MLIQYYVPNWEKLLEINHISESMKLGFIFLPADFSRFYHGFLTTAKKNSGPGCSKLTMSLVNVSLKF